MATGRGQIDKTEQDGSPTDDRYGELDSIEVLQQEMKVLENDEQNLRRIEQKEILRRNVERKRNEVKMLRDRCSISEDNEDPLTIPNMDIFDFTFFLFVCDTRKHHLDCKWNRDSGQMKIDLTKTNNEIDSQTMHDAIQQLKDAALNTRMRESYRLENSERMKANEFLNDKNKRKQCSEVFVDAGVSENEQDMFVIMSTAENDDKFRTVKHNFEVQIGRRTLSKRSVQKPTKPSVTPKHSWTFFTFEKIKVTIVNDTLETIDGTVDGIVNPTNEKLDATGQISKVLEKLGGETYIQSVKKSNFPANRKSTVLATDAGIMKTRTILHVKCPQIRDKTEKELQEALFACVGSCLEMAEEKSLASVAIPLLLAGNAAIPVKRCGQQYAFALMEFSRKRQNIFAVQEVTFIEVVEEKARELFAIFDDILPKSCKELLEIPKHIDKDGDNDDGNLSRLSTSFSSNPSKVTFTNGEESLKANINVKIGDVRDCTVDAIVCPVLQGEPYGGLLSVSIKCAYRHAFPSLSQMDRKVKNIVTTSCYMPDNPVKFIFQVHTPLYKTKDDTNKLKESIHKVFKELNSKPEIKSVAFPLMGVADVENEDCVRMCCRILVEAIFEYWSKYKKNVTPLEIFLVNKCSIISECLREHVQTLAGGRLEKVTSV